MNRALCFVFVLAQQHPDPYHFGILLLLGVEREKIVNLRNATRKSLAVVQRGIKRVNVIPVNFSRRH